MRANEIQNYFAGTQPNLHQQVGMTGILPWFQPNPVTHMGYNTASYRRPNRDPRQRHCPNSLPLPSVGGPWLNSAPGQITLPRPQLNSGKASSMQSAIPAGRNSSDKSQRWPNMSSETGATVNEGHSQIAKMEASQTASNANHGKKLARSAVKINPVALTTIPVHTPSMERTSRQEQLIQQSLLGQFVETTGTRKPKGSINVPNAVKIASKLTSVPTPSWPLKDCLEPQQKMWTTQPVRSLPNSKTLAPPLHMLTLPDLTRFRHEIRPLSPMPASPVRKETTNTTRRPDQQD